MKDFTSNDKVYAGFLVVWTILNLFTASSLELYSDEAYYWMYSKHLSWGYFDHPPVIAVLIALGKALGKTELAVRIGAVLMTSGSLWLLYVLIKPAQLYRFIMVLFSFLVLHILGFMALPDVPFFFFALCFIYSYKQYLNNSSWLQALCFGVCAALMIYSKYHGALVILFVLLSNPALFKDLKMYVAGGLVLILLSPHIYWQYANHFPSFQYHLVDRAASSYKLEQTLQYALTNLLFLGGLVSLVLFIFTFKVKAENTWERALKFNLYGTLAFFFFYTFKGQYIEPNWTIFCVLPIVYFGMKGIEQSRYESLFNKLVIFSFLLMIVVRIHLQHPFGDWSWDRTDDFNDAKTYARQIDAAAGEAIIVAQRYQDASLLNFYLDKPYNITAANIHSRHNQYDVWKFDTLLNASRVAYVNNEEGEVTVNARYKQKQYIRFLNNANSFQALYLDSIRLVADKSIVACTFHIEPQYKPDASEYYLVFRIKANDQFTYASTAFKMNEPRQELAVSDSLYQKLKQAEVVYSQIESRKWHGTNQRWIEMER